MSAPRPDIIPELDEIRSRILDARSECAELVDGITDEQFNAAPGENRWSMCQCIDHLVVSGEKLLERIDAAIEKAHRDGCYGRGPFRYGRGGEWITTVFSLDGLRAGRKFPAPRAYRPRTGRAVENALSDFQVLQDNLVERIEASSGLDLARVKITSPASRLLRLSLGQWFRVIAGHQERHLEQLRKTREAITGGSDHTNG